MNDNKTIQQLSDALNKLLDAFEISKNENKRLVEELSQKDTKISELEDKIAILSDATETNSNEMDTMLSKISSILSSSPEVIETNNDEVVEDFSINTKHL